MAEAFLVECSLRNLTGVCLPYTSCTFQQIVSNNKIRNQANIFECIGKQKKGKQKHCELDSKRKSMPRKSQRPQRSSNVDRYLNEYVHAKVCMYIYIFIYTYSPLPTELAISYHNFL